MIEFHNRVIGNLDRIELEIIRYTNTIKINFNKKQKRITCYSRLLSHCVYLTRGYPVEQFC